MRSYLLIFLTIALLASPSEGEPKIDALSASVESTRLSVRFVLDGGFDRQELNQALESGLPTGFTYYVEVIRKRPNWFDGKVDRATVEVVATYNSRTREYLLNHRRNGRLVRSEVFTDVGALKKRMTSIDEADLFDIGEWRPSKLRVRVRADVMRGFLLYVIPWDTSTGWSETRVRTVPR